MSRLLCDLARGVLVSDKAQIVQPWPAQTQLETSVFIEKRKYQQHQRHRPEALSLQRFGSEGVFVWLMIVKKKEKESSHRSLGVARCYQDPVKRRIRRLCLVLESSDGRDVNIFAVAALNHDARLLLKRRACSSAKSRLW